MSQRVVSCLSVSSLRQRSRAILLQARQRILSITLERLALLKFSEGHKFVYSYATPQKSFLIAVKERFEAPYNNQS